jgi:predicted lysophospholipase L1 biosynthesis ABC-type transport system permease subunit
VVADIAQWGALGIAVGVPLALAGSRLLASLLYEARVTDPLVLVTVAGLLVTATIGATVVPLRRALAIPALEACRSDEPGDKQLDRCPLRADGDYGFVNCR